jgi:peptidoglycan hydrolase-like protein with peptidoglycan-binding domain
MTNSGLSVGAYGAAVQELQANLRARGLDIPPAEADRSFFGPGTRQAVLVFQKQNGLPSTGMLDAATSDRLAQDQVRSRSAPRPDGSQSASPIMTATRTLPTRPVPSPTTPTPVTTPSVPPPPPSTAPMSPSTTPILSSQTFVVRGQISGDDGSVLPNVVVQAFDRDLRREQALGQATTDASGQYEIRYTAGQFARAEKGSADLIVRILDVTGALIDSSPVSYNAPAEAVVDLMVGGGRYPGPSEYEQLLSDVTPLLDDVRLADLREDDQYQDFTFLARETGRDQQQIAYLPVATRLASSTGLPVEVFYAFARQGLPLDLQSLLAQGMPVLRKALVTSVASNIIPARILSQLAAIMATLQRLSSTLPPPPPSLPAGGSLVLLTPSALDASLLDNLKPGALNRSYVNDALNASLRGKLAAAFADAGQPDVAGAIAGLDAIDIAAVKDLTVRAFVANHVMARSQEDTDITLALQAQLPNLSDQTTIGSLLRLDRATRDHPLFQNEVRKAEVASILGTSPLVAAKQLQGPFISLYAAHDGSNEEFWDKLRQTPTFQAPGLIEDIQYTLQLGLLTLNNVPLVGALRARPELKSPRDLVGWDADAWRRLLQAPLNGRPVAIPDVVPGSSPDEKTANYIGGMMALVRAAFPTAAFALKVAAPLNLDLNLVNTVLSRAPQVDLSRPLPPDVDLTGLAAADQARARSAMDALRREINMFPEFRYAALLGNGKSRGSAAGAPAFRNPIREGLARFLANSPDFEFGTSHVDNYIAANKSAAFRGVPDADQPAVTRQLKRVQRIHRVIPDADIVVALMGEGFGSASGIARVPQARFVTGFSDVLGGEEQALAIHLKARHIHSRATMLFTQVHQAMNDPAPRVI